jgi:hypothetical protein
LRKFALLGRAGVTRLIGVAGEEKEVDVLSDGIVDGSIERGCEVLQA